jgi:thioredoxin 1
MKFYLKLMMLFLVLGAASCISGNVNNTFSQLDAKSFQKKWENECNNGVLIDVRTPAEFQAGHIESAKNIDYNNPNFESELGKIDKNKTVFVYCLSGGRSSAAVSSIENKGFKNIIELEGGMMAWRSAGLPESTKNIIRENNDFDDFTLKNELVLVDFYADWCAPCKKMKPILNELKSTNLVAVYPLNADLEQTLVSKYKINNLPTLVIFKKGKEVWRGEGFHSKDQLREIVKRFK